MKFRFKLKEYFEEPPYDYHTGDVEGKDIFDRKAHIPFYDKLLTHPEEMAKDENLKGEIVMMSPNEYYKECATKIFNNTTVDDLIKQRRYQKETLDYLKKLVTKYKRRMFMPYINYAERGQEGLHRMMVAGDLFGWDEKFPVLVITTYDQERRMEKEKKKEQNEIYKILKKAVDFASYYDSYEDEEALEETIRDWVIDYVNEWYSEGYFKYYDPLNYTMWYYVDDEEGEEFRRPYLTFVIADKGEEEVTDNSWSFDIDAKDISFDENEEEDDDVVDWDGFQFRLKDLDIDLDDPNLDIDAILKK